MTKADKWRDEMEHEKALKAYLKARQLAPDNVEVLDALGEMWLELGEVDRAREVCACCEK